MARKQYLSAFRILDQADKDNTDTDIFLLKAEIALYCYVKTFMHQSFAFADLKPDEKIEDLRSAPGLWPVFDFQINRILDKMLAAFPGDKRLRRMQGDYYYEVYRVFGARWLMPAEEILRLSETGYTASGFMDSRSLNNMGLLRASRGDRVGAEKQFLYAVNLLPDDPEANYNLAYLLFSSGRNSEARPFAEKAVYLYAEPEMKGDASYLAAVICDKLGEKNDALKFSADANRFRKGSLVFLRGELTLYVKYGMFTEAEAAAFRLTELDSEDTLNFTEISSVYAASGNRKHAIACFDSLEKKYSGSQAAAGNAVYVKAVFMKRYNNDYSGYKSELKRALEKFRMAYPPDHQKIKQIQSEIERDN
jgi:tetratricopeptide (TPR) repeat protein